MPDNVTNGIFTNHCYEKMWDLFRNHDHEIGSDYLGDKSGKIKTNCIIYCKNVMSYAHKRIGRPDIAERVSSDPEESGVELAKYLTRPPMQWKAHYWNPDVRNSRDGDSEHSAGYRNMVVAQKTYYKIPLSGVIINYNLIYKKNKTVWTSTPTFNPLIPNIPLPVTTTNEDLEIYERVSKVKFAFGIARGARHTFMLSYGELFEVHYTESDPARLYGKKPFRNFGFNSGAIIVPPDSSFTSRDLE